MGFVKDLIENGAYGFKEIQSASHINRMLKEKNISWNDYTAELRAIIMDPKFKLPKRPVPKRLESKLMKAGITWEDVESWLDARINEIQKAMKEASEMFGVGTNHPKKIERLCPECGNELYIGPVNNHPRLMIGGDFKCQWKCLKCDFEEFSKKEIKDEILPYLVEIK